MDLFGLVYVTWVLSSFFACIARLFVVRSINTIERQRQNERTLSACRNPTFRSESAAARSALVTQSFAARAACVSTVAHASTSRVCASASSALHRRSAARTVPWFSSRCACFSRSTDRLLLLMLGVPPSVSIETLYFRVSLAQTRFKLHASCLRSSEPTFNGRSPEIGLYLAHVHAVVSLRWRVVDLWWLRDTIIRQHGRDIPHSSSVASESHLLLSMRMRQHWQHFCF